MTLSDLLTLPYERNARGPRSADCWGMVRLAREHLFGREPLPVFNSVASGDVRAMTRETIRMARGFVECDPRPGAIATAWQGSTCPHVGIVIESSGRLMVLDTNLKTGACITRIPAFVNKFTKVVFYDN